MLTEQLQTQQKKDLLVLRFVAHEECGKCHGQFKKNKNNQHIHCTSVRGGKLVQLIGVTIVNPQQFTSSGADLRFTYLLHTHFSKIMTENVVTHPTYPQFY